MNSEKSCMTYNEVVRKAQREVKKRGVYGNKNVSLYACDTWLNGDQIKLWTYWQGHQYKDIDKGVDILLVGQDWGNPSKDPQTVKRIEAIQTGKSDSFYNDHASITDINLKELFKVFNCDIEKADPGLRLLFTNYSLGYRKGNETGGMTKTLMRQDAELFDDLVKALRPKIIICLGKITYEAVTNKKAQGFVDQLKKGKPFVCPYPRMEDIISDSGFVGDTNDVILCNCSTGR